MLPFWIWLSWNPRVSLPLSKALPSPASERARAVYRGFLSLFFYASTSSARRRFSLGLLLTATACDRAPSAPSRRISSLPINAEDDLVSFRSKPPWLLPPQTPTTMSSLAIVVEIVDDGPGPIPSQFTTVPKSLRFQRTLYQACQEAPGSLSGSVLFSQPS